MNETIIEGGVIAGNFEDKYASRNPIARRLMQGFLDSITELVETSGCDDAIEVGCGEGKLSIELHQRLGLPIRGTDFSPQVLNVARRNAAQAGAEIPFEMLDLNAFEISEPLADLVICCEVLEHLPDPEATLRSLTRAARRAVVLSVPREPLWRVLNVARGKYWSELGNTPGHLQHWSSRGFAQFVGRHLEIVEIRTPLPWTAVLARPRFH
ncbi:MAG TPA: class I SAM-dependent methyltransferase [Polyangiaceae bacterium]|jgi:2-polyprenyl-3-methyl-5-hydroxy-6-metoxy-1,4-benzoquinol methylase|nr:class I SAM-dependent methyltransferase [Polyangiaceae bacterium]